MVKIKFVEPGGEEKTVEAQVGLSVMENATRNNVNGIVAECGGQCSCATCHIQVAEEWFDKVGPAEGDEEDMLEFAEERVPTSRLSCQIEVTEELDGLVVNVPESQG